MNMFWTGVLAGVVVSAIAPGWVKGITAVAAVVLSGLLSRLHQGGHFHLTMSPALIGVAGVAFGLWSWHYARKRGLRHLADSELRTRWERVRDESKWGF
jgi:Na+-translocating ferredoxin:NAD+ oxidoreductase RnfD subunit